MYKKLMLMWQRGGGMQLCDSQHLHLRQMQHLSAVWMEATFNLVSDQVQVLLHGSWSKAFKTALVLLLSIFLLWNTIACTHHYIFHELVYICCTVCMHYRCNPKDLQAIKLCRPFCHCVSTVSWLLVTHQDQWRERTSASNRHHAWTLIDRPKMM